MASARDTATFFLHGTATQFEHVLGLYPQALRVKAEARAKKPEELIKLDNWYQTELPKKIKSRGKDAHLVHEELVQCMKWKQTRGKFYPQLSYLIKVNTPRAVMIETKKAFKKLPNLEQAITALSNLKGVGTTMASALLAAAAPECAAFMADECLMAIPEIEGIDYTTKEYLKFAQHIQTVVERLNRDASAKTTWSPHKVELALWTHYVLNDLKPDVLTGVSTNGATVAAATTSSSKSTELAENGSTIQQNGDSGVGAVETSDESNQAIINEDSSDKPSSSSPAMPASDLEDSLISTNDSCDSHIKATNSNASSNDVVTSCSGTAMKRPLTNHDAGDNDNAMAGDELLSVTTTTSAAGESLAKKAKLTDLVTSSTPASVVCASSLPEVVSTQ